ncbi:MAG TPA: tetratricopeptide repeat protein [Tepidisphaeraceae bacterium]|jgi:tetratricopeptide (TPR) repeat protein
MPELTSPRLTQLNKLLERAPRDTFLLYGLGMEYKKLGAPEKSIEFFDKAIESDAGYCYAYYQRGQVFEQTGNIDQAKMSYREGIAAAQRVGDSHASEELKAALSMIE